MKSEEKEVISTYKEIGILDAAIKINVHHHQEKIVR